MLNRIVLLAASGIILTSWNAPYLSRQQNLPSDYEDRLVNNKDAKKENGGQKQKKKCPLKEQLQCGYVAHQKNRLAYFADRDCLIWFNNKENKYTYFLSNFYPAPVKIWDMKFYCSEAAFQAAKFLEKPEIAVQFTHLYGEEAWKLAQKLSYQQRGDWYQEREKIMLEVLRKKFEQHPELSELLLATGDAYLVEKTSRDSFWADGGDGRGKNRLGNLLMQVRGERGGIGVATKPD